MKLCLLKAEMVGLYFKFHTLWYIILHSLSHSSFTLIPLSVSYFCVTVPNGLVSRSFFCQHHLGGWQGGWGPRERHQTRDAGLGLLASPHPISIWVTGPSICLRMIWNWLSQARKKGPPPVTNDNLRINITEEGVEKKSWITLSSSISLCWPSH